VASYVGAALLGVVALCVLSVGFAQLDEIVVTAQKREQGVNDVGITVNAFDATQNGVTSGDVTG
jgi:hypothetical protein